MAIRPIFFAAPLIAVSCALAALQWAAPVAAQEGDPTPRDWCFTGKPLPECAGFWIIELRGQLPLVNTARVWETIYTDTNQGTRRRDVGSSTTPWGGSWDTFGT